MDGNGNWLQSFISWLDSDNQVSCTGGLTWGPDKYVVIGSQRGKKVHRKQFAGQEGGEKVESGP